MLVELDVVTNHINTLTDSKSVASYGALGHMPPQLPTITFFSPPRSQTKSITADSIWSCIYHAGMLTRT